jgi:HD-GYP domain-containing protein (c-di-GMP phosphodiesterase class II)
MLIQTHAEAGYDIVKNIKFPWPIAQMIYQHHERMDGSGYPKGLKGEEISLGSRIIAVADVIEAMSTYRPYRSVLGIDAALDEIKQNRGTLYDVQAVNACLKLFAEKRFAFT